jgi:hypothetical protein
MRRLLLWQLALVGWLPPDLVNSKSVAVMTMLIKYEHHHFYHTDQDTAERLRRIERLLGYHTGKLDIIMAAIDDLKTAIAGLITEGTADIAALVAQINAQSNQDPAIVALTTQVTDATTAMHQAFTGVTGVALPPATPPATPTA